MVMNETNAGGVRRRFPFPFRITVADNAGTDGTWGEASDLTLRLPQGFLPLVAPLLSGHSDLAIGSRLHRQSDVVRGELLVLAQRNGLRIHEVPVDWVDDPDSRVDIVRTALDDLKGVRRMLHSTVTGRTRIAVPRQARTPQVPAARKSPEILPARAATSLDTLEYAS